MIFARGLLITMEQMQKMWPRVTLAKMQPIMDELNANIEAYQLNTRLRQSHFLLKFLVKLEQSSALEKIFLIIRQTI
jgi:hypothetical protein